MGSVYRLAAARRLDGQEAEAAQTAASPQAFTDRVNLDRFDPSELSAGLAAAASGRRIKRAVDIAAAIALLVLLSPLLAITAIAIRIESPGPALYRQRRVGKDGAEFEIYKFRSMRADAERDGAQWAALNDNRITRVGAIIRRTRIDEIPQAVNILRGEMSFVGPRPERPEFVRVLEARIPHYNERHRVRPGITGWAQVKHEYTASVEGAREKLCYDLHYIKRYSPIFDIAVIAMTVRVALFGLGAR